MKLIEILVRDLDKHGGWPDGADGVVQDGDGGIWFYQEGLLGEEPEFNPDGEGHFWGAGDITRWVKNGFNLKRAQDCESAVIHRQQYEAAVAASKEMLVNKPVEWDGQGLPPIGTECEVRSEDFSDWMKIKVAFVHNGEIAAVVSSSNPYLNDKLEKFSAGYNRAEFRPIRTEAERKRSDICDKIYGAMTNAERKDNRSDMAEAVYDAIAAGSIPGVKLEAPDA